MNRNLLKKRTGVCSENAKYSGFILPTKFGLKIFHSQKVEPMMQNVKKAKFEIERQVNSKERLL